MAFVRRPRLTWQLRSRSVAVGERTLVMGILNVTPDSFSDGGEWDNGRAAVQHGVAMLDDGVDVVDIGGESTRPGAQAIGTQEEQDRVIPVVEAILQQRPQAVLSVDTYKAATARAAVAAGAEIVNDVSGLQWDAAMPGACAKQPCGVILMHTRGRPSEWRTQPRLAQDEVVPLVESGLAQSLKTALGAGIERGRIVLDPGFGFGKAYDNNYPLLAHLERLLALGQPLLAGVSRKSFLGRTLAGPGAADVDVEGRGNATVAAMTAAILAGASMVRVHEVRAAVEAARIADAILSAV